ncbi:shikimate kinase [Streptococcus loxodontisalivarius]|uniref:Shikimate kinase n=1 Tax=Streptococcus loxodontisalivarius TaxID=1349415 RepID=A0ABS2PNY5_9STRE|nr:shikimate kinase [Streptococcus loxodontisalivarius]MBM7641742.1 shikimate kinase [Streptococcus loxodontisalivarius]
MAKIIIGFMGSGKSTIAKLLDPNYIDMDALITERIGMSISDFFAKEGEAAFRQIESQVLAELAETDAVISTGGGVVVTEANRQILANNDHTIYLKADFDTLCDRISRDKVNVRPLFENNSRADFKAIFDGRQDWYQEAANKIVEVAGKTPEEIIEEIR